MIPGRLAVASVIAMAMTGSAGVTQPAYSHSRTLAIDGLAGVAFDAEAGRLWLGTRRGLVALAADGAGTSAPITIAPNVGDVELAANLRRLFFVFDGDRVAYIELNRPAQVTGIGRVHRVVDLVYEPVRRELFAFTATSDVVVLNAATGKPIRPITLPGLDGRAAVAAAGQIYLTIGGKDGVFRIDGTSRAVARVEALGDETPHVIEVDQANGRLFAAYARRIVALEIASGTELGRLVTSAEAAVAYDPGSGLLVATNTAPPKSIETFRVTPAGLERVDRLTWVAPGLSWLEPLNHGFVQRGETTSPAGESPAGHTDTLLVWKSQKQEVVDGARLELATSALRTPRSPS